MVLPNAVLVPNALLPLHIYEDQYRAMLEWCLERNRLFCIALQLRDAPCDLPENFCGVGGLGMVRACVGGQCGTANLILQGLARVRFGQLVQTEPFRIAEIRPFKSEALNQVEADALGVKVVEICGQLEEQGMQLPPELVKKLRHVANPEILADVVTQTFVRDPQQQQGLLEEPCVSARLRALIRLLQAEMRPA